MRHRTKHITCRKSGNISKIVEIPNKEPPEITHVVVVVVVLGQVADVAVARHDGSLVVDTSTCESGGCGRFVFAGWAANK